MLSHRLVPHHGGIANTLAGNPEPPFGFGNAVTPMAPASGTLFRFASNSSISSRRDGTSPPAISSMPQQ